MMRARQSSVFILVFAAAVGISCTSNETANAPDILPESDARGIVERDLVRNPGLRASLGSTVMLELEGATPSPEDTGPHGVDEVPYRVTEEESVQLCLQEVGTLLSEAVLRDEQGRTVLRVAPDRECATATLAPGNYVVSLVRSTTGDGASPAPAPVFIHSASATAPLFANAAAQAQCTEAERNYDPRSFEPGQRWLLSTPKGMLMGLAPGEAAPLRRAPFKDNFGDFGTRATDLFQIVPSGERAYQIVSRTGSPVTSYLRGSDVPGQLSGVLGFAPVGPGVIGDWMLTPTGEPFTFRIQSESDEGWFSGARGLRWLDEDQAGSIGVVRWGRPEYGQTPSDVTLAFRYVDDASRLGPLKVGEAAIYTGCGFTGRVVVVNDSNKLPLNTLGFNNLLLGPPRSIKLGCDTQLDTRSDRDLRGQQTLFKRNFDCNDGALPPITSFRVVRTRQLTIQTKYCSDCNLDGVDLSGLNLERLKIRGGTMRGARFDNANLSGAELDNTDVSYSSFVGAKLVGATLASNAIHSRFTNADLTNATLGFADFSDCDFSSATFAGARLQQILLNRSFFTNTSFLGVAEFVAIDWRDSDIRAAKFDAVPAFKLPGGEAFAPDLCNAPRNDALSLTRFAGTRLGTLQFPVSVWKFLDLSDARNDSTGIPLVQRNLDTQNLCGLRLHRFDFQRFNLGGTKLRYADLSRANLVNADMRLADLSFANLNGASFAYANLTDARMEKVIADSGDFPTSFVGAHFTPSNVVDGRFTGASFNNASFLLPTERTGALFAGAQFVGADLSGANLSGISFLDSNFTNATLDGTVLDGAKLGGTRASFFNATFCGAALSGADFSRANLTNALFPLDDTTVPNTNDSSSQVPCAKVVLGGKPTIEAAVIANPVGFCPNASTPAPGQPCTGTQWQQAVNSPPPRCLFRAVDDIGEGALEVCAECNQPCDCDSRICAPASPGGPKVCGVCEAVP